MFINVCWCQSLFLSVLINLSWICTRVMFRIGDRWEPERSPGTGISSGFTLSRKQPGGNTMRLFGGRQRSLLASPWKLLRPALTRPVSHFLTRWRGAFYTHCTNICLFQFIAQLLVLVRTPSRSWMNVIFSCIIKKRCVSSPLQRARLPLLQQQVQELEAAPEEENTKIHNKSLISEHNTIHLIIKPWRQEKTKLLKCLNKIENINIFKIN